MTGQAVSDPQLGDPAYVQAVYELELQHERERMAMLVWQQAEWAALCRQFGDEPGAASHDRSAARWREALT